MSIEAIKQALKKAIRAHDEVIDDLKNAALDSLVGVINDLEQAIATEKSSATQEPVEMSPEFTDTARAALLWVLWHHQGGSSPIGQPIRFALGMDAHERLSDRNITEAKRWAIQTGSTTAEFHTHPQPKREWVGLTDEEIMDAVRGNCIDMRWPSTALDIARAIEAKLKEKNHDTH